MKGDFTRDTFRPERRYSSVRMQQGRVQMDADWNEAEDIRLVRERTEIRDVVGPCGAPIDDAGFAITFAGDDFAIGAGRLYVEGVFVENDAAVAFGKQADYPDAKLPHGFETNSMVSNTGPGSGLTFGDRFLLYLDVWEEHVTALEDDLLREVALNGPDTATRLRPVWQVKAIALPSGVTTCGAAMETLPGQTDARLAARAKTLDDSEACTVKPGARYKRLENQLYRVEVETAGNLTTGRFKWSRDNGTIASGFTVADAHTLTVDRVGRDGVLSFQPGGWIEITDRRRELLGEPGQFVRVKEIAGNDLILDPAGTPVVAAQFGEGKKVRRWDSEGPIAFVPDSDGFMLLEDGVAVALTGNDFRKGDYWLIPARTVTADVEWPYAVPQPPKGVAHRRCPLAIATFGSPTQGDSPWTIVDCREPFVPLADVIAMFYGGGDGQVATFNVDGVPGLAQAPTVGVARGKRPVEGAKVRWTVLSGGGSMGGDPVKETDANGLSACDWNLGSDDPQRLRADLLDSEGDPTHIPIVFTATLPQPTGGTTGCCRSVGERGDYPTITAAILDLVFKQRLTGICLCLMPGEHPWPEGLDQQPPEGLSLEITGIRDASIIVARESVEIGGIVRFVLSDVAVQAPSFRLNNVQEADLQFVKFEIKSEFFVENVQTLRMSDCAVRSSATVSFEDVQDIALVRCTANVVSPQGHAISVMAGRRLAIQGCVLAGVVNGTSGATLAIGGIQIARIVGNDISARRVVPTDKPTVPGVAVQPTAPSVAAQQAAPSIAAQPAATGAVGTFVQRLATGLTAATAATQAKKLVGATTDDRAANANAITNLVASAPLLLGQVGAAMMTTLANTLADPKADVAVVAATVSGLNAAVSDVRVDTGILALGDTLGVALEIDDGSGACFVEDNVLRGTVGLYGDPGTSRITGDIAKQYQARMKQFNGAPTWGAGSLAFSRNQVVSVFLASSFVNGDAIKQLFASGTISAPVFRTATFSDNVFAGLNEFLFFVGSLTGNVFPSLGDATPTAVAYGGVLVARSAAFTGNVTTANLLIIAATISSAPAGNVGINFA